MRPLKNKQVNDITATDLEITDLIEKELLKLNKEQLTYQKKSLKLTISPMG